MSRLITATALGVVTATSFAAPPDRGESIAEALRLLPDREIHALLLVPNPKRASDGLLTLLQGMDRANLLLGVRPIDQVKSTLGVSGGVDDLRTVLVVVTDGAGGSKAELSTFYVVPVTDAPTFLQGNFMGGEQEGEYTHAGERLWARAFGRHVVVSPDEPLAGYRARGDRGPGWIAEVLGAEGRSLLDQGEVFLVTTGRDAGRRWNRIADPLWRGIGLPGIPAEVGDRVLAALPAEGEPTLTALEFDPLALIVRSSVRLAATPRPAAGDRGVVALASLPAKPYYLAASISAATLREPRIRARIESLLGIPPLPDWISQGSGAQFGAYPSRAGVPGGLLNDAVLVLRTPHADQAVAMIKEQMLQLARRDEGIQYEVAWDDEYEVDGVGAVAAYEVRATRWPPESLPFRPMAFALIFGRMGWRGFVTALDEVVLITFSRRPTVLKAALDAAPGRGFADDAVIRTMRQWIRADSDLQMFIAVGRFGPVLRSVQRTVPGFADLLVPQLEPGLPPVGLGLRRHEDGLAATCVIPAGVLSVGLDVARNRMIRARAERGAGPAARQEDDQR